LYLIPQRAEAGTSGQCWAAHRPRYRSTFSGGAEFIIDFSDTAEDYFSAWSGLTMSPLAGLQFGLALQRSRVIRSPRDVQLGPQVGISFWASRASTHRWPWR
jgi:hypothetical protein